MSTVDDAVGAGGAALGGRDVGVLAHEYRIDTPEWVPYCACGWRASRAYDSDEFDDHLASVALKAAWPILSAPIREHHRPYRYFELEDSCADGSDEHREEHHHECTDMYGEFYCDQLPVGVACTDCCDEDGERVEYPCSTIQAVLTTDRALGIGEDVTE